MNRLSSRAAFAALHRSPRTQQRGATLVVVLVLLLLMTLLGLASLRGTLLEERMTSNLLDRSIGFQNAEAALREAEALVAGAVAVPANGCNAQGICATPVATDVERWRDAAFAGWRTSPTISAADPANRPQFIVEFMGEFPNTLDNNLNRSANEAQYGAQGGVQLRRYFRVTARSRDPGANDRSFVVLQSSIAVR
jgi:type IV pilus assembly protein PilX